MRNIFLIILFSFFSLQIFSQNESQKDIYYNLSSTEEKLDFLFETIFNKQIENFNDLKKKNLKLEKQLKSEKRNYLIDSINGLNKFIAVQQKNIKQLNLKYSNLMNELRSINISNEKNNEYIKSLKSKISSELKLVESYSGSLDPSLLILLEKKARNNKISTKNISQLIKLNKVIFQAELILSQKFNNSEINNVYNSLDEITNFYSDWHKSKIYSLKLLLDNYCKRNSELILSFKYIDEENLDEHSNFTLNELVSKRSMCVNYPFLSKELERKITDINYKYILTKCN